MSKYDLNDATIEIRYQGCAEAKYCYPEIIKIL
jgi:thiol:disulfide interchange protein